MAAMNRQQKQFFRLSFIATSGHRAHRD